MSSDLVFVRRTKEEVELFGGTVFIDIDGRNIGQLGYEDVTITVNEGFHKIKMYKSHTYNTHIGIAEVDINVIDEKLLIQYSSPLLVSQPGNIIVSEFKSYSQIEKIINEKETILSNEKYENERQQKIVEETTKKNSFWIIFWVFIIPAIIWAIYEIMFWDMMYDL
jgi:hypothetical protein